MLRYHALEVLRQTWQVLLNCPLTGVAFKMLEEAAEIGEAVVAASGTRVWVPRLDVDVITAAREHGGPAIDFVKCDA